MNKPEAAYIVHILCEEVLQGLAHSIALLHNLEAPVITCAEGVRHERRPADDGLQPLLQGRPCAYLVVGQRVHVDALLLGVNGGWGQILHHVTGH